MHPQYPFASWGRSWMRRLRKCHTSGEDNSSNSLIWWFTFGDPNFPLVNPITEDSNSAISWDTSVADGVVAVAVAGSLALISLNVTLSCSFVVMSPTLRVRPVRPKYYVGQQNGTCGHWSWITLCFTPSTTVTMLLLWSKEALKPQPVVYDWHQWSKFYLSGRHQLC